MNTVQVGKVPLCLWGDVRDGSRAQAASPGSRLMGSELLLSDLSHSLQTHFFLLGPQKSCCIPKHICTLKTNTFSLVAAGGCEQAQA